MTSYHKISWSLEAARFGCRLFQSVWNLTGTSAAALPRCLSNFIAIKSLQHPISPLRDFTRFGGKTSHRLVNRGPCCQAHCATGTDISNCLHPTCFCIFRCIICQHTLALFNKLSPVDQCLLLRRKLAHDEWMNFIGDLSTLSWVITPGAENGILPYCKNNKCSLCNPLATLGWDY